MSMSPETNDLIDPIQTRLEEHGWSSEAGSTWRWVDHTFANGHAELHLRYFAGNDQIRLDYESEDLYDAKIPFVAVSWHSEDRVKVLGGTRGSRRRGVAGVVRVHRSRSRWQGRGSAATADGLDAGGDH